MIITDISLLKKSEHDLNYTKEQSIEIAKKLFNYLAVYKTGTSLSSNQIGINDYRVCVTNTIQPLYFINPIIVEHSNELYDFVETCLSLPQQIINTKRYKWIKVKADNFDEPIIFGVKDNNLSAKDISLLLNINSAVQKSIDMLDCITILDNESKYNTIPLLDKNNNKYGRNQLIKIYNKDTNKSISVKHKYLDKYINSGWIIE